ncbi:hypothetical protein TWF132_003496 [Orbilia oligospora]|nr:hypothetical protein TWF132_003496 [Orbilia oligospora]
MGFFLPGNQNPVRRSVQGNIVFQGGDKAVVACPTIVRHTGEIIYSRLTTLHSPSFPLLHAFAVVRIIFVSLEAFVVCPLPPTFQLASRQPVSVIIINHIRGCISAFTFGTSR